MQFEFEFELRQDANDAYAKLIMMTWPYQQGITVAFTGGCYSPSRERPRCGRLGMTSRIVHFHAMNMFALCVILLVVFFLIV